MRGSIVTVMNLCAISLTAPGLSMPFCPDRVNSRVAGCTLSSTQDDPSRGPTILTHSFTSFAVDTILPPVPRWSHSTYLDTETYHSRAIRLCVVQEDIRIS